MGSLVYPDAAQAGGGGSNQPMILSSGNENSAEESGRGVPTSVDQPASEESFPPPEDIPSGRGDDVFARQLREAAMKEPDPELREKLWDEYRNYNGIGEGA